MQKKLKIIGLIIFLGVFFNTIKVFAQTYNPLVETWLEETNTTMETIQVFSNTDNEDQECDKKNWTSFIKSFLSYGNFISDWGDLMRNDCLREDIWSLEDKLQKINQFGFTEAKKCNNNLETLQETYQTLKNHIKGLRRYGENPELEENESTNCPHCKKMEIVGTKNIDTKYYSTVYTDNGCELTREKSKGWQEEWNKLKESMNLFKNIKKLWQEGTKDFSWGFTSKDYADAQKTADSWWDSTWNIFYSYKGQQLSFRHLRDGEDSLISTTRIGELTKKTGQAIAKVLLPAEVDELVEQYSLQLDVYQALSVSKEQVLIDKDLQAWKAELESKYKISRDTTDDLENYLINWGNSIQTLIDPQNPILLNYYEKLKNVASNHCQNLYGACK